MFDIYYLSFILIICIHYLFMYILFNYYLSIICTYYELFIYLLFI